jgi:membrane fusion protein (multidrug efflux system)
MEPVLADDSSDPGAAVPAPKKRMKPRTKLVLLAVVAIVVVVVAIWFVRYETRGKFYEGTNDAYVRADMVTVSPKVAGYVEEVFVRDNQDVKAGQPLVRIDPRDYRASTAQAQAQIDVAAASADSVRATIREQEAAVAQARAQLISARADATFAAGEVARYEPLAASGAETREKVTTLRNQATQTAAQVAAAQAALSSAERRIGSLRAQITQAQAQGEAARAQLSSARVNLGSTLIRASVDGRIGDKTVRVGQYVQTATPMMSLVPLQALYVSANFKETQVGLMRPGQPATIEVDALPGVELRGHVESVSPGTGAEFSLLPPQNATGNFTKIVQRVPVRIAIDAGPDARRVLVPGLSVTATVDTISAKGALARIEDQEAQRRQAGG